MVLAVGNSKCLCCLEKHHHSLTPWLGQAVSCYEADTCYCPCKCHYEDWWNVFWTLTHASILILCVRACVCPSLACRSPVVIYEYVILFPPWNWHPAESAFSCGRTFPYFLPQMHFSAMRNATLQRLWAMDDVPTDNVKQAMPLETGLQGREIEDLVSQFVFSGTTSEKGGSAISTNMVTINNSYFKNNVKRNMSNCPTCKNGKTIHLVTMASVVGWFFCVAIVLIDEFEIYIHGAGSLPMFRQRKTESKWIKTTKT